MARSVPHPISDESLLMRQCFAVNEQMNQVLIVNLDNSVWSARPLPGRSKSIADIFAHLHGVRRKWVRLSAPELRLPGDLDARKLSKVRVSAALAASARSCQRMMDILTQAPDDRRFLRDGWGKPWKPGTLMVTYMVAHEAHHRGQILLQARTLGAPLPRNVSGQIWNWEKLWKDCDLARLPHAKKKRRSPKAPSP